MPIRNIATIAVAIFLGLVAVLLVRNYLNTTGQLNVPVTSSVATTPVVVAAQAVTRGAVLQANSLKVVNLPQDSVPAGAFQSVAQLTGSENGQRFALRSLVVNEPILPDKISGAGGRSNLAVSITDGMRAVSLRSDDVAGVAGFVLPGDRVDVLLTRAIGAEEPNNSNKVTQVLAENVLVLGVDQSNNDESDKPVVAKAVTIEVTPDQAQTISLGQSVGAVSLSLRHVTDGAQLIRKATTVSELGFEAPRKPAPEAPAPRRADPPPPPPPPQTEVRVTRGVDTSLYLGGEDKSLEPAGNGRGGARVAPPAGGNAR